MLLVNYLYSLHLYIDIEYSRLLVVADPPISIVKNMLSNMLEAIMLVLQFMTSSIA